MRWNFIRVARIVSIFVQGIQVYLWKTYVFLLIKKLCYKKKESFHYGTEEIGRLGGDRKQEIGKGQEDARKQFDYQGNKKTDTRT